MAENSTSSGPGAGKFILAAVIVLAGVVPAGYVAFDYLRKELKTHQAETRSVVMELQTATVEEIRASSTKTTDALKQIGGDTGGGNETLANDVSALKKATEEILAEQKSINQGLSRLLDGTVSTAKPAEVAAIPEADFTESVYFGVGKAEGEVVAKQVAKLIPDMKKQLATGPCQVDVTGFADTLGNDLTNLKLSRARADFVAARLRAAEIDVYSVEAWGERRLKVHTYDGVRNENNRRADIEMHCGPKKPIRRSVSS